MSQDALINLAAFAVQVCIIAGAATLLLTALRIGSAGARYVCWRVVLGACVAMPLILQRPATEASPVEAASPLGESIRLDALTTVVAPVAPATPPEPVPWAAVAAVIIVAGAAARAAWLAVGFRRLRALCRRGAAVRTGEFADIQNTLGTRASLLIVAGLNQPATFGVWRPVVLLPHTLADSPAPLRRAVVTHELFHVQRRDWLWVLAEEALKTVLWFHPAIAWLTSRIQLAREELVDELTVLATGNRKAYIEALLAFADAGRVQPAPAFARRRHLFTRILRLSKESVMSSPRIVVSAATVVAMVVVSGWYASAMFPILSAAPAEAAAPSAKPTILLPRYQVDRLIALAAGPSGSATAAPAGRSLDSPAAQPGVAPPKTIPKTVTAAANPQTWGSWLREAQGSRRVAAESPAGLQGARSGGAPRPGPVAVAPADSAPGTKAITPENPIPRRVYSVPIPYPAQLKGSGFRANLQLRVTLEASGAISDVRQTSIETAGGDATAADSRARAAQAFVAAAADAIRQWRYQPPADPPIAFFVAVAFDGERDGLAVQSEFPAAGRVATVRFQANPSSPALADLDRLLAEMTARRADLSQRLQPGHPDLQKLDEQIRELERVRNLQQQLGVAAVTAVSRPGATALTPLRVGGNIRPPTKTKQVDPVYPEVAKTARVQGVVILEATIDEQGRVAEARILRSIPLLDQAALDAVRQWEFTPTLLNGSPVPIIMTMTVQFVLPAQ